MLLMMKNGLMEWLVFQFQYLIQIKTYACLSTHTAKSRKDINDLKKILPIMLSSANNLKKVLFKD